MGIDSINFDSWDTGEGWFEFDGDTVDTASDSSSWDSAWDWASSEQGTNVLSSALKSGVSMWQSEQDKDDTKEENALDRASETAKTERIAQHNKSINLPLDLNIRKFTR